MFHILLMMYTFIMVIVYIGAYIPNWLSIHTCCKDGCLFIHFLIWKTYSHTYDYCFCFHFTFLKIYLEKISHHVLLEARYFQPWSRYPTYKNILWLLLFYWLKKRGPSWSCSYDRCIYNYLSNRFLSLLQLWARIPLISRCTRYNIMW